MISRIPAHPHWNIVVAFCNMLPRSEICEEWAEFNGFTSKPIYSTGKSSMNEAEMCLGLHYSMTCTDHCLQHLCHWELSMVMHQLLDNGADADSANWWSLWLVFLPLGDEKTWWSFATAEQWRRHNLETYGLNDLAFMFYIWQCSKAHPQKLLTILQILKLHLVFFCRFIERQELAAFKFIMSKQPCGHVGIDMYHLWRSKEWRCVCHHRKIEVVEVKRANLEVSLS